MTNKRILPYLLDDAKRINLNIPGSKLNITLNKSLYWTLFHKHQHLDCILLGIRHYFTLSHISDQLKAIIIMNIWLLYSINKRTKICPLLFHHPFLTCFIPARLHLQLIPHFRIPKTRLRIRSGLYTFLLSDGWK